MGLILTLHVDADPDAYVGRTPYHLVESVPDDYLVLRRETDGQLIRLTASRFATLEPTVKARVGQGPNDRPGKPWVTWTPKAARVEFVAPRCILILLGRIWRRSAAAQMPPATPAVADRRDLLQESLTVQCRVPLKLTD